MHLKVKILKLGKNQLIEDYEIEKDALLKKIKKYGEERGFKLKNSKVGMVFTPIKDKNLQIKKMKIDEDQDDEEFYKVKRELRKYGNTSCYKIRDLEDVQKKLY